MNAEPISQPRCRRCGAKAAVAIQNEYYCNPCSRIQLPWLKRVLLTALLLFSVSCVQPYVPGPKPDDDTVVIPDVPVSGDFRILIVEETDNHRDWPQSQLNIRTSSKLDDFVKANNAKLRLWDDDVIQIEENSDFVRMLNTWREKHDTTADNRAIVIEHGAKKFDGDLPKTVDDTIKLLEGYK